MSSVYGRLFAYRERQGNAPLENFLTEALADILNRMPRDHVIDFGADLFFGREDARKAWRRFAERATKFSWSTQHRIRTANDRNRIPDILLDADGNPALILENKVGSPGAKYGGDGKENGEAQLDTPETKLEDQLSEYGRWLASQCQGREWQGALVLVTHSSLAPREFGSCDRDAYGVPWQHTCRWHEIWRRLKALRTQSAPTFVEDVGHKDQVWLVLAEELANFIEEQDMASELMTSSDLAALEVFIGSAGRIEATFERIRDVLRPTLRRKNKNLRFYGPEYHHEGRVVEDYAYIQPPHEPEHADWYFAWGIRFASTSKWWMDAQPPLPDANHVFAMLGGERTPKPPLASLDRKLVPKGWSIAEKGEELIAAQPLHEFSSDPEKMASEMATWIAERLDAVAPILPRLMEKLKK